MVFNVGMIICILHVRKPSPYLHFRTCSHPHSCFFSLSPLLLKLFSSYTHLKFTLLNTVSLTTHTLTTYSFPDCMFFPLSSLNILHIPGGAFNAGDGRDMGLIPGSGRSPGEGNGNPLQYSCLENPKDREA